MRRWIARAAALYPRRWREEYGDEFAALLEDVKPNGCVFANVLGGAVRMQMTMGANWLKLIAATAVAGAIVAVGVSFTVAPRYVSETVLSVTPQGDPVRPSSPKAMRARAAGRVAQMEAEILSRTSLSTIITDPRLDLYKKERQQMVFETVIDRMRRDIRVQARPSADGGLSPVVFSISFTYPDQVKAREVVKTLVVRFTEDSLTSNRDRTNQYQSFWHDMILLHRAEQAPPPPPGDTVVIVNQGSESMKSAGPNRIAFTMWGIGAGPLLGLLAALAIRWPRYSWQLGVFAAVGFLLSCAAWFVIPHRYTSTAVMRIAPASLTENPIAAPPTVTSAAEFLREMTPKILNSNRLDGIVRHPRFDWNPKLRAGLPVEELVRKIQRDLRIEPVAPALGASAAVSAFRISFSYSDPHRAQWVVQQIVTAIQEQRMNDLRHNIDSQRDFTVNQIFQRKGGENLDMLDSPSLPETGSPEPWVVQATGVGFGLLLGDFTLYFRRRHATFPQPA